MDGKEAVFFCFMILNYAEFAWGQLETAQEHFRLSRLAFDRCALLQGDMWETLMALQILIFYEIHQIYIFCHLKN